MAVVLSGGSPLTVNRQTFTTPRVGGWMNVYGGKVQSYAELYRQQPNLRLVIRFLGRNVAQLGLKGFHRVSETERLALEPNHELRSFLKTPDTIAPIPVTRHRWVRAMVEDLALYDCFLAVKMRNETTGRLSAVRIPPQNMTPAGNSWLWPEFFRIFGNQGWKDYTPDQVIYLAGHNPADPRVGVPPVEALRRTLSEDVAAGEAREQMWNNSGRQSGFLKRPLEAPKWSPDAKDRFTNDWQAKWSGDSTTAGGTPILEEGMDFLPAAFTPKEAEYLGARRLTREEVAAQYFIPPVFVGILENANFSNVKEQHRSLYADTLGPWLDWIETDLEVQLVPEFANVDDVYLSFNIAEKLAGSFEEQAAALSTLVGAPVMLRNEGRAKLDLPPVDGGDVLVTPLNVLIGGQASPRDTAPPSPTTNLLSGHAHGAKSYAELVPLLRGVKATVPRMFLGWEAKHAEILGSFFDRQKASVLSRLGAGNELAAAFDEPRWTAELADDLLALSVTMTTDLAGHVAEQAGATYDPSLSHAWLASNTAHAAAGINATTYAQLGEAYSGVTRGTASRGQKLASNELTEELRRIGIDPPAADDDGPTDPLSGDAWIAPAAAVFAVAVAARAVQIATSRTTAVGNFARHEGADQAGLRSKTWISSGADNSRHADLDGETVALSETFSNGGQWPGDPALGVDETAGCLCSIDFSNEGA